MSLRISAVTQGWLILAVVLCGMYSLAPSWRVILQMFQSSSVVAVSFDSAMVELMFTSFRLVQFALALTGTSYWACFFLVVLMMNSQYGMLWSERPGMTSVLEMSCGQFVVQIQGVILSSGFPYQLIKSWWRPGLGAGLESWCCWLPVPPWKAKIPAYEEMSSGKLSQVTVQVFSNWFHQQRWACSRHTVAFKNLKTLSAMVQSELNTVSMPVPADVLTGNEIWKIVRVKGWLLDMLAHCRFICRFIFIFIWTHYNLYI